VTRAGDITAGALGLVLLAATTGSLARALPAPLPITGGRFEASGVVHVPGTRGVLFVDDGRNREIFWMEIAPGGAQHGAARPIPLGADVTDLEGVTTDGTWFYVVGSQSKKTGFDGDGLVRFKFDAQAHRIANVETVRDLKGFLAEHVPELAGTGRRIGDDVLNIEAIAWDPREERLLLGLRAPVVDGQALIIPLKIGDGEQALTRENLRVAGEAIRLPLGGDGIRSVEYDPRTKGFRLITGAGLNAETRDFRILEWDGSTARHGLREVTRFDRRLKPEGIATAPLDGRSTSIVVFDTSRFTMIE
jgi:hypothetical protein